jgi:hypothetical protein
MSSVLAHRNASLRRTDSLALGGIKKGLLTVTLPKTAEAKKATKKIEVKAG